MIQVEELLRMCPVIPVLVIERADQAGPMARALARGGLRVLEVTLRTPEGLGAIAAMRAAAPEVVVGAGTVNSAGLVADAQAAGAQFIVSPGLTETLAAATAAHGLPFLPGVATAGEILRGLELGFTAFKFFPAETSGGVAAVRAFAGPFAHVSFCPTGGITLAKAPDYLGLANVRCVGGSWLTPRDAVAAGDWDAIEALAAAAAALAA